MGSTQALRAATHPQRYRLLLLLRDGEQTVKALVDQTTLAPNLVSHHLRELRRHRLVSVRQYGRERRYALDTQAVAAAAGDVLDTLTGRRSATERRARPRVLFLCVRNAGRSQMALAFFERAARGRAIADAAGSEPAAQIHDVVRRAMSERGIELIRRPQRVTDTMLRDADVIVDMGCGEDVSSRPGARRLGWRLPDPEGKSLDEVRAIRDRIARRAEALARELTA